MSALKKITLSLYCRALLRVSYSQIIRKKFVMYNWNIDLFWLCTYILYKIYLWKYPPPPLECFWNGKLFGPPASHSSTTSQCPRPRNIKMFILVFRQSSAVYPNFFFTFSEYFYSLWAYSSSTTLRSKDVKDEDMGWCIAKLGWRDSV